MKWPRNELRDVYTALDAATTYAEWLAAAEAHDQLTGAESWRAEDSSPHYDAVALRTGQRRLAALRASGDGPALAAELSEDLYRHLGDLSAPQLYDTAMAGTKRLVGEYLDEVEASMRWLATHPIPGIPSAEVSRRFRDAWRVFGRSALLLSGGATLGFYHLGVVRALFELDLLPHILSGASTGAMIAAGVCARSDDELRKMFAEPGTLRLDGLRLASPRRIASQRALLEPEQLYSVLRHNVGDLTFADAYARSGRELAISVSPTRARQKPRLLSHLTSPEALVARAALASSALPGLFPPVALTARAPDGREVAYIPDERWVNGSIHGDLPMRRLSRLFNVNHFVVSQTNPHVLPFVRHHGRRGLAPLLFGVVSTTVRGQAQWATDVGRRVVPERGGGRLVGQLHALFSQDYAGDIQIHPQFYWPLFRKLVANPTAADLAAFLREGARSVWPRVAMIRDQTRIGRVFREVLGAALILMLGLVVACHRGPGAIGRCAVGFPGSLYGFTTSSGSPEPQELGIAEEAFDQANKAFEKQDFPEAIEGFLASARAVRTIPDAYGQMDHVIANSETAYQGAARAWAAMGRFEAEGRAVLEGELRDDPRLAASIARQLAAPPVDCAVGRWRSRP